MADEQGSKLIFRRLRPSRRICLGIIIVLTAAAGLAGFIKWQTNSFRTQAQRIKVGDSKQQVEKLLGRPPYIFLPDPAAATNFAAFLLSVHSETWVYGSSLEEHPFHSEFPYFWPFRFRIFGPDTDDVVIVFSSREKVSKVVIPEPTK
jgi:hypothetical protein